MYWELNGMMDDSSGDVKGGKGMILKGPGWRDV